MAYPYNEKVKQNTLLYRSKKRKSVSVDFDKQYFDETLTPVMELLDMPAASFIKLAIDNFMHSDEFLARIYEKEAPLIKEAHDEGSEYESILERIEVHNLFMERPRTKNTK